MARCFKITLKQRGGKRRRFFFEGRHRADGWFIGKRINPATTEDMSYFVGNEPVIVTQNIVQPEAVAGFVEYYKDPETGKLARKQQDKGIS